MRTIYIIIAEHLIKVNTSSVMAHDWVAASFRTVDESEVSDIFPHLTLQLDWGYGVPFVNFDVEIIEDEDRIAYHRADYRLKIDKWFHTAHLAAYDEFALKHAMMNLYSAYIVHHRWGLLVHSSCVVENGKAYLFSGYSGAGKSTVAKLSMPRPLLSDEATVVKLSSSGKAVSVFNSPFRSELEDRALGEEYPLHGIYFLRQSMQVASQPLKKGQGLLHLTDKVFYWGHDPQETSKVFQLCRKLVDSVPAYDLYFQKNDSFWEMIS